MQNALAAKGRKLALKGILIQIIVSLLLVAIVALVQIDYLYAVVFGCLSFLLPHSFFAYWVFRYAGATKTRIVAESFNQGTKVKLILTCILFVTAFSSFNAHPFPLLGAYVVIMLSQWLAMLVFD
jgi:ATP synthase protein I